MTIYLAFFQALKPHPIPAYSFWEYYIKNGIEEAGHTWKECSTVDWAEGLFPKTKDELVIWKTQVWTETITYLKNNPTDIFLSYLYPHQVDTTAIDAIKALGIVCVNFFCDHIREFTSIPKEFGVFNLNWVPEYKAVSYYEKAKLPFIHLPMPMWVEPKHRNRATENDEISFIGSKDIQRLLFFEELVKKDIKLNIYGAGWKESPKEDIFSAQKTTLTDKFKNQLIFATRFGIKAYLRKNAQRKLNQNPTAMLNPYLLGKPDFENYIRITKQSLVTLGINRYPSYKYPLNQPNTYSRLRDIEAPMLGACYLTEYTHGLEELYEIGKEIEVYHTVDELIEKIVYLRSNKSKRDELRVNGQIKALSKHSIPQSIDSLWQKIFK